MFIFEFNFYNFNTSLDIYNYLLLHTYARDKIDLFAQSIITHSSVG